MNEPDVTKNPEPQELDETQAQEVGGGGDDCTITQALDSTGSLIQAYENLVDFTSHVIERVSK